MTVAVDNQLLTFNAFGIITITPKKVMVNITAVSGDRAIKRQVSKELKAPLAEVGDQTVAASFGVWMEPGKQARITVSEIATLQLTEPMADIPEVSRLLEQAIQMVENSAHHP
jgi:hypothetical protein